MWCINKRTEKTQKVSEVVPTRIAYGYIVEIIGIGSFPGISKDIHKSIILSCHLNFLLQLKTLRLFNVIRFYTILGCTSCSSTHASRSYVARGSRCSMDNTRWGFSQVIWNVIVELGSTSLMVLKLFGNNHSFVNNLSYFISKH